MREDLVIFGNYLRDKPNIRGGTLTRPTIQRNLSHLKVFLSWCVSKKLLEDDGFKLIVPRAPTKAERLQKMVRRAFTEQELVTLFQNRVFEQFNSRFTETDYWFFLLALFCGARLEELINAPAKFVDLGGILCIDLREVATKTLAAPRLIPLHPELIRLGILELSRRKINKGYTLLQSEKKHLEPESCSKRLGRLIDKLITKDRRVVFHSFRHNFRQLLRASGIGDELSNKIFGHTDESVGAMYGRDLSADEAAYFVRSVKSPIYTAHLKKSEAKKTALEI